MCHEGLLFVFLFIFYSLHTIIALKFMCFKLKYIYAFIEHNFKAMVIATSHKYIKKYFHNSFSTYNKQVSS